MRAELQRLKRDSDSQNLVAAVEDMSRVRRRGRLSLVVAIVSTVVILVAIAIVIYRHLSTRHLLNINTQNMKMTRLTDSGNVGVAAISGDGRYIAYSLREANHSLWVQQIAPESKVRIVPPSPDAIQAVTFSPDASSVYFVRANKGYVIPTLGRTLRLLIESSFSGIGVSPDGTKTGIRPRCMRFNSPSAPAWSPDGKRIAMLGMRKTDNILSLYPVAGGAPTIIPLQYTVSDPKWLPDQSGLILTIGDLSSGRWKIGPSRQIWIRPFPTGNAQRLTNDLDTYSSTSVTNDSALIAAVQIQSVEPIKPLN